MKLKSTPILNSRKLCKDVFNHFDIIKTGKRNIGSLHGKNYAFVCVLDAATKITSSHLDKDIDFLFVFCSKTQQLYLLNRINLTPFSLQSSTGHYASSGKIEDAINLSNGLDTNFYLK